MAQNRILGEQLDLDDVTGDIAVDPVAIGNIADGLANDPSAAAIIGAPLDAHIAQGSPPIHNTFTDVVQDTTPQLGGDLDVNGYSITGADYGVGSGDGVGINVKAGDAGTVAGTGGDVTIAAGEGGASTSFGGDLVLQSGGIPSLGMGYGSLTLFGAENDKAVQPGDTILRGGHGGLEQGVGGGSDGVFEIATDAGSGAELRLFGRTNSDNYIALKAPVFAGSPPVDITFVLPELDGANGEVLQTDCSGNLSFVAGGGGGIANVVEDTTPQLGGDLDVNGFSIITANNNGDYANPITLQGGDYTGTGSFLGHGGHVNLRGGHCTGTGNNVNGGNVTLYGGNSTTSANGNGGAVSIKAGQGSNSGAAGSVSIIAGRSTSASNLQAGISSVVGGSGNSVTGGLGGPCKIFGGPGGAAGAGGDAIIRGGVSFNGTGGDVTITGGPVSGTSTAGFVIIEGQKFPQAAGTNGYILTTDGTDMSWAANEPLGIDLGEYTVATLPAAATYPNSWALATDGGSPDVRTIVRSDGTNWKVVAIEGATVA